MHFCVTSPDLGASVTDMLQYTSYPADGLFGVKNVKGISLNKLWYFILINSRNNSVVVTYLSSCFIQTNAFNILDYPFSFLLRL
jgi:hypothetical protein